MFQNLTEKINAAFKKFKNKGKLTEDDVKTGMREIKLALLEADVNFKVVREFIKKVTERAVGADVLESLLPAQQIVKIVNEELTALMGGENEKIHLNSRPPTVIMMVGLQGAGKTTHCGKLAGAFRKQGRRPLLVACDVYRPAAADQLETLGGEIGVRVYRGDGVDPVKIAKEGVQDAIDNLRDVVIVDTAGRLHTSSDLMRELEKVVNVTRKRSSLPVHTVLVIDATTVGLDVMEEPYTYKIRQNTPASYAVIEALEEWGYEYEYSGSMDVGFYLRRISRGGMMGYPAIPEHLWSKILQDGLTLTGQTDNNSLGEFDYTQGSGWMYSVGGNTYAGKGLSGYYLTDGDTLYLRFTLAYGKDIGGYSSTGGSYGLLPSYCGKWLNGTYIEEHVWGEPTQTVAPDCTHPGEISTVCTVCGDRKDQQEVPPLGHDFVETGRTEPGEDGTPGYIEYTCSRCGEQKQEPIPAVNAGWLPRRRRLPDYAMTGARYER